MPKFEIVQHAFTSAIIEVLQRHFGEYAEDILQASPILGYLNNKTKAAKILGIDRASLWRHLKSHEIQD